MDFKYIDKKKFLLENYVCLGLTEKQLIILLLCIGEDVTFVLDYDKIQNCMNIQASDVTAILSNLFASNKLSVALLDEGDNIREVINCEALFKENSIQQETFNVFANIEKIYGKSLSNKEVDVISKWISINNYSEDKIIEAFGIASLKNVSNLNYIEKILENGTIEEEEVQPLNIQYNWLEDE